jgi:hypothetical protein
MKAKAKSGSSSSSSPMLWLGARLWSTIVTLLILAELPFHDEGDSSAENGMSSCRRALNDT